MQIVRYFLVAASAALFVLGCSGKSEDAVCGTSADCDEGQICQDGVCETPSETTCNGDPDCPGGYICLANKCERKSEEDAGGNDGDDTGSGEDAGGNNGDDDMGFDNVAPEVVSVDPAEGSEISRTPTLTLTFSEPLRPVTINVGSIILKDPANNEVTLDLSYDEEAMTATVSPVDPLRQATGYRLIASEFVKDEAGNNLVEWEGRFYTPQDEPAHYAQLARDRAPKIYQAITDPSGGLVNIDIPTRVNFDNDYRARDNKSTAQLSSTNTSAAVYYNIVESHTHLFITYAMYYPARQRTDGANPGTFEHDFTGVVLVIDKESDALILAEGISARDGSEDEPLGFKPTGSTVSGTQNPQNLDTFDASVLDDGGRYPMFITAGVHEGCNWLVEGSTLPSLCLHDAEKFPDGPSNGVVLSPADTGQTYDEATENMMTGFMEMDYELVPLADLWRRRDDVGSELLWQGLSVYSPDGMDRPSTPEGSMNPVVIPGKLVSDDGENFGKPPFRWFKQTGRDNAGQWLIDPTYLLRVRYDFGMGFSEEYCFNMFLEIDHVDEQGVTECATN